MADWAALVLLADLDSLAHSLEVVEAEATIITQTPTTVVVARAVR